MINTDKEIFFNFTYYALKLLGKNLYSNPWAAISELVANGLDAGADSIFVLIDMKDKSHSKIEIFDNGSGMSYDDLCGKYTMIGRNKRNDYEDKKEKVLGRKGIGKLAALYLSKKYYLTTKHNEIETTYVVDSSKYKDNDQPSLRKVSNKIFLSQNIWVNFQHGTMIELTDVDLKNIGEEKIKSLNTILADYYLFNNIEGKIFVCVLDEKNRDVKFKKVEKEIYFSTMYAIFDNTGNSYYKKLKSEIYLTKPLEPKVLDKQRATIVLSNEEFNSVLQGEIEVVNLKGEHVKKEYNLNGWIGIQGSLEEIIQKRNDPNYKKFIYRGNSLRLYVRNKLAVDNFIKYIGTTQALSPYIEGEICFDILDDDDLEDISTSNREGYPIGDVRVQKLIEIVNKIVRTLMTKRASIGSEINEEIAKYREKEKREALLRERNAFAIAQKERQEREKIESAKKEVEVNLENKKKENEQIKNRLFNIEKNFTKDGEVYKHGMHLAVNFAKEIRGNTVELLDENCKNVKILDSILAIDRVAEKIERLPNTIEQSSFSLNSQYIKENIIEYIEQYLEIRDSRTLRINVNKMIDSFITEFDFSDISMMIENIISNAKKAKATKLQLNIYSKDGFVVFDFINNGIYLDEKYKANKNLIFEYGESTTGSFGIGCYHIKKIVELMNGEVTIFDNTNEKGVTFRVVLGDGKI